MNTCDEHRNTIVVHQAQNCPLCDEIDARQKAELEVDDLRARVEILERELKDAHGG